MGFWGWICGVLLVAFTPGPSTLYVMACAAGGRSGIAVRVVAAFLVARITLILLLALGVERLFHQHRTIATVLETFLYLSLILLGYRQWKRSGGTVYLEAKKAEANYFRPWGKGCLLGMANPKGLLMWVAALPIAKDSFGGSSTALSVLILTAVVVHTLSLSTYGWLGALVHRRTPTWTYTIFRAGGLFLAATGFMLLVQNLWTQDLYSFLFT